jgi:hypothetical protein
MAIGVSMRIRSSPWARWKIGAYNIVDSSLGSMGHGFPGDH